MIPTFVQASSHVPQVRAAPARVHDVVEEGAGRVEMRAGLLRRRLGLPHHLLSHGLVQPKRRPVVERGFIVVVVVVDVVDVWLGWYVVWWLCVDWLGGAGGETRILTEPENSPIAPTGETDADATAPAACCGVG